MNIEREKPEKIEPWTEIPSAAIQAKLDKETAKLTRIAPYSVSEILHIPLGKPKSSIRPHEFTEQQSLVLVTAFVTQIGKGGF